MRKRERSPFILLLKGGRLRVMIADASRYLKVASIALVSSGTLVAAIAVADEAADRKLEAQRLFAEGQAALEKGEEAKGCELMRTSMGLFAVANSLFNVAQCDEREGKLALALEHWKRGMALIDATDQRAAVVKKAIDDLEVRLPRVRILVSAKDEPVDVLLDNEVVLKEKRDEAIYLDPGKHVVTIRKAGHDDRSVEIVLNERERTEVAAEPGAAKTAPLPTASVTVQLPPPPPPPGVSPLKVGGFVALGVGGAALLGAAITGGMIVSQDGQIIKACGADRQCPKGIAGNLIDSQNKLLPVNAAMWGIGIAGAGAGAVMLILSSRNSKENPTTAVTPLVLPRGGGIGLSGRF